MLHFTRMTRKLQPKPGDVIYLLPIRYWELDTEQPIALAVEEVVENSNGGMSVYGLPENDTTKGYFSLTDFNWFYTRENARKAQEALAILPSLITSDDTGKVMRDHFAKKKAAGGVK